MNQTTTTIERQEASTDAPRLRHIIFESDIGKVPLIAMCGHALPIIEGFDLAADLGPTESADCVVCRDLWAYWSTA